MVALFAPHWARRWGPRAARPLPGSLVRVRVRPMARVRVRVRVRGRVRGRVSCP